MTYKRSVILSIAALLISTGPSYAQRSPGPAGPFIGVGNTGRNSLGEDQFKSTMDPEFGARGNRRDLVASLISFPNTSFTVTFTAPVITATTATIVAGAVNLAAGTSLCSSSMSGYSITYTQADGSTATNTILGCNSTTQPASTFILRNPAPQNMSATATTITTGVNLVSSDTGKSFCIASTADGVPGNATCGTMTVITASSFTSSVASANSFSGNTDFVYGTDDRLAIVALIKASFTTNPTDTPYLIVPKDHFISADTTNMFQQLIALVNPIGGGSFAATRQNVPVANQGPDYFRRPVIPFSAGAAPSPQLTLDVAKHSPAFEACGSACLIEYLGDSQATPNPDNFSEMSGWPVLITTELAKANPGLALTACYGAIGGQSWTSLLSNPAQSTTCIPSTASGWLTQALAKNPDILTIGFLNNQQYVVEFNAILSSYTQIRNNSKVPDLWLIGHTSSSVGDASSGGMFSWNSEENLTMLRGITNVLPGIKLASDFGATMNRQRDGYDPTLLKFERRTGVPFAPNRLNITYKSPFYHFYGYSLAFTEAGAGGLGIGGAAFWANHNNRLMFRTGGSGRGAGSFVNIRYNTGTTRIEIRCDAGSFNDESSSLFPGLACKNPSTGLPPVIPTASTTYTIASGTPTTLTSTAALFTAADTGTTWTIPGAGGITSIGGFGNYSDALITVVTFVNATTLTLTTAATSFPTSAVGPLFRGNAWIDTGYADTQGQENFGIDIADATMTIWFNTQENVIYSDAIIRPGSFSRIDILTFKPAGGSLMVATGPGTALSRAALAVPVLTQRAYTDRNTSGGYIGAPINNASSSTISGGSGNHTGTIFAREMLNTIKAQGLSRGLRAAGLTTIIPTTGQTIVVPARTGTYTVSPAGLLAALTITLPSTGYAIGDTLTIVINQIITSLTISNSALTIQGAAISNPTTAGQAFIYRAIGVNASGVTIWQRV